MHKVTSAMISKGFEFFRCENCFILYPAKKEHSKNWCLYCLQGDVNYRTSQSIKQYRKEGKNE